MNLKYEDLHYSDLGASLRNFNDVIKTRKQGDMGWKQDVYELYKELQKKLFGAHRIL